MSLAASVSRAWVETWTWPAMTTWRMAWMGARAISWPSLRTMRCSLRLPTWAAGSWTYRTAPSSEAGMTRVMAERLLHEQPLGAELDGVVVPTGRLAVVVARGGAVLGFDGHLLAGLLFDQVEDAGEAESRGRQGDAAGFLGVAVGAGAAGEGGI